MYILIVGTDHLSDVYTPSNLTLEPFSTCNLKLEPYNLELELNLQP